MKAKAKPPYDGEYLEVLQAWEADALKPASAWRSKSKPIAMRLRQLSKKTSA